MKMRVNRDSFSYNRNVILVSAVATALSTTVLFFLPDLIPLEAFKRFAYDTTGVWYFENPFTQLRFFGGVPGGFIGGYLARDYFENANRGVSLKIGLYGVLFGLLLLWVAYVLYNLGNLIFVHGLFPPPIYLTIVNPLILAIPLIPVYLLEGAVFGRIGGFVSDRRE